MPIFKGECVDIFAWKINVSVFNRVLSTHFVFTVKVKWGKEVYPDVEINTDEPPLVFKAQLFALTGVNPVRQKVMMKGGSLKDDTWGNIQIVEGQNILMMGSKDEDVPVEPTVKPMFVEDMTETELATVVSY